MFFRRIWQLFLLAFSFIFPKSKKIIIYGAWYGKNFSDNSKYLFLSAQDDKNHKHIWITKNKSVVDALRKDGMQCYYYLSLKGIYYQLRAQKAIICVGYYDMKMELLSRKVIIQLWHGIPLKKIGYDAWTPGKVQKTRDLFFKQNYIIYSSDSYHDIYKSAFGVDDNHLILSGQPRNDLFFNNNLADKNMSNAFANQFNGRKTILYMPTHRQEGKVKIELNQIFNLDTMNDLLKEKNAVLLIKKHFYHFKEEKIQSYSNIIELRDEIYDAQFLLSRVDILITDYSSCFIDFLLRDKPILFYQYDAEDYVRNDRELYFDSNKYLPGKVSYNYEEFIKDLAVSLEDGYIDSLNKQVKDFYFNVECQKTSSQKLLNTIYNIKK